MKKIKQVLASLLAVLIIFSSSAYALTPPPGYVEGSDAGGSISTDVDVNVSGSEPGSSGEDPDQGNQGGGGSEEGNSGNTGDNGDGGNGGNGDNGNGGEGGDQGSGDETDLYAYAVYYYFDDSVEVQRGKGKVGTEIPYSMETPKTYANHNWILSKFEVSKFVSEYEDLNNCYIWYTLDDVDGDGNKNPDGIPDKDQGKDDWWKDFLYGYKVDYNYRNEKETLPPVKVTGQGTVGSAIPYSAPSMTYYGTSNYRLESLEVNSNIITTNEKDNYVNVNYVEVDLNDPNAPKFDEVKDQFFVTFDPDNDTKITMVTVNAGDKVSKPVPNPEKVGYKFLHWVDMSTGSEFNFETEIDGNKALKAVYEIEEGTVEYSVYYLKENLNASSEEEEEDFEDKSNLDTKYIVADVEKYTATKDQFVSVTPEQNKYDGFRYNSASSVTSGVAIDPNENSGKGLELFLVYDRNNVIVTIDEDNGNPTRQETIPYGTTIDRPETPVKDGFDFDGWTVDGASFSFSSPVTRDITIKATWVEPLRDANYIVKHYQQDVRGPGYTLVENETEYLIERENKTVRAEPKNFTGFHENTEHKDRKEYGRTSADTVLELVLYYDREVYTVTVDKGDGSEPEEKQVRYGDTIDKPDTPSKEGEVFNGWVDENDEPFDFDKPITEDKEVKPSWVPEEKEPELYDYTVNYHFDSAVDTKTGKALENENIPYSTDQFKVYNDNNYVYVNKVAKSETVTTNAENNVVDVYYELDNIGKDGVKDGSDGIPDKYQVTVYYKAVNGSVSKSNAVITKVNNLGEKSVDGIAKLTLNDIPTATADYGYYQGTWDKEPTEGLEVTDGETFTITFIHQPTSGEKPEPGEDGESYAYTINYHYDNMVDVVEGTGLEGEQIPYVTYTAVTYKGNNYAYESKNAKSELVTNNPKNNVVDVYYSLDNIGNGGPDGIPDKYQITVYFRAINGIVTKSSVTLVKVDGSGNRSETGTAKLSAGDIPMTAANEGYEKGTWDREPTIGLVVNDNDTFTITYVAKDGTGDKDDDKDKEYQFYAYTINYHYSTEIETIKGVSIEGEKIPYVTYSSVVYKGNNYVYISTDAKSEVITKDADKNVVDVYYDLDNIGKYGSDGIPDSYQVTVYYKGINGTVSKTSVVVTKLDVSGKPSATGIAKLSSSDIPTTKGNEGYENGTWDTEPVVGLEVNNGDTFTITYTRSSDEEKDLYSYVINYHYDDVIDTVKGEGEEGDKIPYTTETSKVYKNNHYVYVSKTAKSETITKNVDNNVVDVYYELDNIGASGSDGIADKYQVTIYFKVVNGTVSKNSAVITKVDDKGNPSETGVAKLAATDIPTAKANEGYRDGTWDKEPVVGLEVKNGDTFTITYVKDQTLEDKDKDKDKNSEYDYVISYHYGSSIETVKGTGKEGTKIPYTTESSKTFKGNNYTYVGKIVKSETITTNSADNTVDVYYEIDNIGKNGPDGISDKYQVTVYFRAVNGTVSKSYAVITKVDKNGDYSESGTARLKSADIPTTSARTGYYRGSWDVKPVAGLAVEDGDTFTITYVRQSSSSSSSSTTRPSTPSTKPSGSTSTGSNDNLTDIKDENVALDQTAQLDMENHISYINGFDDGTVRPNSNITRAEVAQIIFNLLTTDYRDYYWTLSNNLSDVSVGAWYNEAISTISKAGIITGYPEGTYKPNNNITRAEFATIISRFFTTSVDTTSKFSDVAGHWAESNINKVVSAGWVTGYPDGTYRPDQYITRAEAVAVFNRVLERSVTSDHMLSNMKTWPDNADKNVWYYNDIQEATNAHKYEFTANEEIWTEIVK